MFWVKLEKIGPIIDLAQKISLNSLFSLQTFAKELFLIFLGTIVRDESEGNVLLSARIEMLFDSLVA